LLQPRKSVWSVARYEPVDAVRREPEQRERQQHDQQCDDCLGAESLECDHMWLLSAILYNRVGNSPDIVERLTSGVNGVVVFVGLALGVRLLFALAAFDITLNAFGEGQQFDLPMCEVADPRRPRKAVAALV